MPPLEGRNELKDPTIEGGKATRLNYKNFL